MLLRIIGTSLWRRKARRVIAFLAVVLGTAVATALINVSLDIGDRVSRALRLYGANLLIVPEESDLSLEVAGVDYRPLAGEAYIDQRFLVGIKNIFWRHNIIGFTPSLTTLVRVADSQARIVVTGTWFDYPLLLEDGEIFHTGIKTVSPFWLVEGRWPEEANPEAGEALVGVELARRLGVQVGDHLPIVYEARREALTVSGLVTTGGPEEEQVFVPLAWLQRLTGLTGKVHKVLVSALTKSDDQLAHRDLTTMTTEEFDRWYCSPYLSSIAYQLKEVFKSVRVKSIRQVAGSESAILNKIKWLFATIVVLTLVAAGLGVMSTMAASVLERRREIGLLKAVGAADGDLAALFLGEAFLIGLAGGVVGYGLGFALAQQIGRLVFHTAVAFNGAVITIALFIAVLIALAGTAIPVRRAVAVDPVVTLQRG